MIKISGIFILWFLLVLIFKIAMGGLMVNTIFIITTTAFVLSFVNAIIQIKAVNIIVEFNDVDYFAGDTVGLRLTLKNKFSFLLTSLIIKSDYFTCFFYCSPFKQNKFVRNITFDKKGVYPINDFNLIIRDVFGITTVKKNIEINKVINIYPRLVDISHEFKCLVGYEKYENKKKITKNIMENQQNDIKDFRVFVPGDSLRRVHWKLSAKRDQLFVKEYEQTNECNMNVFVDLTEVKKKEYIKYDDVLASKVVSIIYFLLKKGYNIRIFINDLEKTQISLKGKVEFKKVLTYFTGTNYYSAADIMDLNDGRRYTSGNNLILLFNPEGNLNIGGNGNVADNVVEMYQLIRGG
ncbi:Uncharacterized conserved protein, DUF58 family, contains vWF domain [Hathewaya proteolytica DSM 3090]|uniref:Uncharacterized conserved protein, DUF58 family, contains vWF domain n=1 Tax=Hathewaya proteolytica DSM 3090 TaxID=1121331 RepID=A0A1M6T790_9CLOT|nr:DUF58 domain-containing protein [Hathewaya proteolytica]SHK52902.1 Uncharacterized conserved protein, DUF58 family, contains vWF domain [Hathewaya proteolytica DSM 3090]